MNTKRWLVGLLAVGSWTAPALLASEPNAAQAGDPATESVVTELPVGDVLIEAGMDAPTPGELIEIAAPPPDVIFIQDEQPMARRFWFRDGRDAAGPREEGAWIGVQLGPVPASLAAHLRLGERGLLVRNVFEGSPADKAGIQRYDVFVKADDKDVVGTVEAFSKTIRERKPGQSVHLTLIRAGQEMHQEIALATAPDDRDLTLKYEDEPDVLLRRDFGLRGRVLRPGPDGNWIMQDLGEVPMLERFFHDRERPRSRSPESLAPDHARRVDKNGETLDVRRQKDGKIEVRREKRATASAPAGRHEMSVEVRVYPSIEELRRVDPRAAELFDAPRAGGKTFEAPAPPPPPPPPGNAPEMGREAQRIPMPPPPGDQQSWREWRQRFFQGPMGGGEGGVVITPRSGLPKDSSVRFEEHADGKITVHKRDDQAELSRTYNNRDEFNQKAPELYKQYEQIEKSLR